METIEEEIEEKKQSGWTKILLILNFIIWAIIVFMAIIFNGVVKAATVNMTNWAWKDQSDNWTFVNTGDTTSMFSPKQISFNFNAAQGNNNGTVYFEADITGSMSVSDITTQWWTNPNPSTTGTVSKNCAVTSVNTLTKHVRCQLNFTITNESDNLNIILNFANGRPFTNATATGSTVATPTNNATTADIVNQTIQITNQIIQSVQESITNTEDVSGNIIYQISNAIQNAAEYITNSQSYCSDYSLNFDENNNTVNGILNINDGTVNSNNNYITTSDYIKVSNGNTITVTMYQSNFGKNYCLYDTNKNKIACYNTTETNINITPTQKGYLRVSFQKGYRITVTGQYCRSETEAILENQNSNTDRIIDRLYQDHQEQLDQLSAIYTSISPDTTDFDDLEDVEDSLHTYTNVNLNSFDVDLDTDTNSWVWNTLTSLLNTSSLVFGMVISILSVGLIKLILNR